MNGILDLLAGHIGGDKVGQIAEAVGADPQKTQAAEAAALPVILTALNRQANTTEGGLGALAGSLDRGDGSIQDDLLSQAGKRRLVEPFGR